MSMTEGSTHLLVQLQVSEWVEFNAPLDTIQVIFGGGYTLAVLYISYSVMDDQRHK